MTSIAIEMITCRYVQRQGYLRILTLVGYEQVGAAQRAGTADRL